ncbi:MAG: alpha/beta hydrolase [Clostridia bacterium]|nr:alpha/beta hydrolase [Clostridia bacterium]
MKEKEFKKLVKQVETKKLTKKERAKAPGEFLDLGCGFTHYEMKQGTAPLKSEHPDDPDAKWPVVLVHGYSTPYFLYDHIFEGLVNEGYTVIRYDLLGRGLSERVKSKYAPEDFAIQLKELIDWLVPDGKCILFGTSMGGSILAAFCAMYPGHVQKIVLYAPAGMDTFKPPVYMKLAAVPVLGRRIFKLVMPKSTLARATDELLHQDEAVKDRFVRDLAFTMQYKGYLDGTHASLVNTILKTKEDTKYYKKMAKQHIPTLVIWGTEDKTMPIYQIDRMAKVLKDAEFVIFEGSGHIFLYDEGERALAHTLPFLEEE